MEASSSGAARSARWQDVVRQTSAPAATPDATSRVDGFATLALERVLDEPDARDHLETAGAAAVAQLATSRGCLPRERKRLREARVEDVVGFIEQLREVA